MKLVFLSTAFPRPCDPAHAPYNLRLCEALATDHQVTVIAPVPWTAARTASRVPAGALDVLYPTFFYPPGTLRSTHAWWLWHSIRSDAIAAVERRPPDAVISYWTWPDGDAAARLARWCGVPSIMMAGGSDVLMPPGRPARRRRIARTLAKASAVVVVGERLRQEVAALGVPPERIAVIRRGVDSRTYSPGSQREARDRLAVSAGDRLLLWVGRLSPVKAPDVLFEALEEVARGNHGRWRCVIVGDGPMRPTLERRASGGPLRDRVRFVGIVEPPTLAAWYRAADALVMSSRSEGMPNVLYEAKACGTPVVATDVGDVAQALDEGDRLVAPDDPASLAVAIAAVLSTPPRRRAARSLPTWEDSAAALTQLVEAATRIVRDGSPSSVCAGNRLR